MTLGWIPADLVASVSGVLIVAVFYLARQIATLRERVARLEGRLRGLGRRP